MTSHPIATTSQHEDEIAAVDMFAEPRIQCAFRKIRASILDEAQPAEDQRACFDWAVEEVAFGAVVWSMNQDPYRPRVTTITRLEHRVGDVRVPGTRWGLDNPDSVYRVIPIDGSQRYLIHGRVAEQRPTENYFTLWDQSMNTVDVLSGRDLVLNSDRTFTIAVDSAEKGDRPNHIRSSPQAHEFYIRDVLMDWATEEVNELSIERIDAGPTPAARSREEQIEVTIEYMERFIRQSHGWSARRMNAPPNQIGSGWSRDTGGALRNQVYVPGWFQVGQDQALVLHVETGGADFCTVPITNLWGTTMNIVDRTSSLNRAQSVANADNTYTYVLSRQDPGVHNWLDTCDLESGMLTIRMAEFPDGAPQGEVGVRSELVPLEDLRKHLPDDTLFVTVDERAQQQATRAANYLRRLPEGLR